MSDWSSAGLPNPKVPGYQYTSGVGLVRTQMSDGSRWQRVKFPAVRRQLEVVYELTQPELAVATNFVQTTGYDWYTTPLLTGESTAGLPVDHVARIIKNPEVARKGYDYFEMKLTLEDRGPATTNP